jgi:hypothetical protein
VQDVGYEIRVGFFEFGFDVLVGYPALVMLGW